MLPAPCPMLPCILLSFNYLCTLKFSIAMANNLILDRLEGVKKALCGGGRTAERT